MGGYISGFCIAHTQNVKVLSFTLLFDFVVV